MADAVLVPNPYPHGPVVVEVSKTALGLRKRVTELDAQIKVFARIATVEDYETVAQIGREAAKVVREATDFYRPEVEKLHRIWKDKTEERASIVNPAEAVKDVAARLTGEWQREQERLRLEEQRRLEAEEREKAEAQMLEEAAALEREGRVEEATMLFETPVPVAPVAVNSSVPKVSGVSKPRDNWQVEVTDLRALVKAVADGKVPIQAIQPDMSWLNATAKVMKGILKFPGIRVVNRPKAAFRS